MPNDRKLGRRDRKKSPRTKSTLRPLESLYNTLKSFNFHPIFRRTKPKPRVKTSFESLPNELLLEIFSHLELKPYIMCHGVCQKWRQLLPLTKLNPIRQRLLNLYHRILETPGFEQTQEWSTQNLQHFDREEYTRCLLQQYPVIPEEFRVWILEWPARLLIQSTWPGLPFLESDVYTPLSRRLGVNWIAYRSFSPRLSSFAYRFGDPSQTFVPALLVWRYSTVTDFLIFGPEGPDLFGRVMRTLAEYHDAGHIPYYPRHTTNGANDSDDSDDTESVISDGERCLEIHDDWICYLETLWDKTVREIRILRKTYPGHDFPIPQPVPCRFNTSDTAALPAPAWDFCKRTSIIR